VSVGAIDSQAQTAKRGPITRAMRGADGRDYMTERPPPRKESGGVKTGQRIWLIIDRKQEEKQAPLTTGGMTVFMSDLVKRRRVRR
jgi:hypothetical protein